jgi:hypothetical protein
VRILSPLNFLDAGNPRASKVMRSGLETSFA